MKINRSNYYKTLACEKLKINAFDIIKHADLKKDVKK